jgi:membrane-associated phospholipid phosphatase
MIMVFDPGITDALRDALPGLGDFFMLITQLGGEIFYIAFLLVLYWAYNKREAILATFVLVVSVLLNYWLKFAIANDRPPASNWLPGVEATNYSTPSGHAQNSAALFGWFAVRIKRWWMFLVAIILAFLIGISRVYIGVHFLGDVLLGWVIGIVVVIIFFYLENPVREYLSKYSIDYWLVLLMVFGVVLTFISWILPPPPEDNFGSYGGLVVGLALGLILEKRFVNFSVEPHEGQKWRLGLRVIIGLVLVIGLMVGLSPFLPSEEIWLRMIRYMLVALTGIFIWPAIFKKANL